MILNLPAESEFWRTVFGWICCSGLLIGAVVCLSLFIRELAKQQDYYRKNVDRHREHAERSEEHMARIESLLERIAIALEERKRE